MVAHGDAARRFTKDHHISGIASKICHVALNPLQGESLVLPNELGFKTLGIRSLYPMRVGGLGENMAQPWGETSVMVRLIFLQTEVAMAALSVR